MERRWIHDYAKRSRLHSHCAKLGQAARELIVRLGRFRRFDMEINKKINCNYYCAGLENHINCGLFSCGEANVATLEANR